MLCLHVIGVSFLPDPHGTTEMTSTSLLDALTQALGADAILRLSLIHI